MMPRLTAAIVGIVLATPAWPASIPFGAAEIDYDPARWEVTVAQPPGAALTGLAGEVPASFWLFCKAEECHGRKERPFVAASATPVTQDDGAPCGFAPFEDGIVRQGHTVRIDTPLAFAFTTTFSGCRAYTPAQRSACATDGAFRYQLVTGAHFGCSGVEGVPMAVFLDLLRSVRPAGSSAAPP